MASIDQVIARARRPGQFQERKRFTVARTRAIEKMRRFALADPHFYVLELIQAAIANGAANIALALHDDHCTMSYIGGGLHEHELGQLFDFLFASKDRTDIGHVRELALGINAALLFRPSRVTVESGNGTHAGTTRMVMHHGAQTIDVGRPEKALSGTYVHIEGMNRRAALGPWSALRLGGRLRELDAIEERCLASPIPIIVNGTPLFGYSSQRTPGLFGYRAVVAIDEGDLYGALGIEPSFPNPSLTLLTHGVSIQAKEVQLVQGAQLGGIICYDRLRKTVDHSGIVEDEILEQLWSRLRPYAEMLADGRQRTSPWVATFLGTTEPASPAELRRRLAGVRRLVLVPGQTRLSTPQGERAQAIGEALGAPVLCIDDPDVAALRALSGGKVTAVRPDLTTPADAAFYTRPAASPPPRPWLISPVEAAPLPPLDAATAVLGRHRSDEQVVQLADFLGTAPIELTVYTPLQASEADTLSVEIRTAERLAWHGRLGSAHPGHVLVVETRDALPAGLTALLTDDPGAPLVAEALAAVAVTHAMPALAEAGDRAIDTLMRSEIAPRTAAASLSLAAIVRTSVARLRTPPAVEGALEGAQEEPCIEIVCIAPRERELLSRPLLRTHTGRSLGIDELPALLARGGGIAYGTVPDVAADLTGLDPSRILELGAGEERLLVDLLGEGAYVRIDRREILAEHRGVLVRDFALGLRHFPDLPLLVEGVDPSPWPPAERTACAFDLVHQLLQRAAGHAPPRPSDPAAWGDWEECRRQAIRHLRWFVTRSPSPELVELHASVARRPLFADAEGAPRSYHELVDGVGRRGYGVLYGASVGIEALGSIADAQEPAAASRSHVLALDPSSFLQLRRSLGLVPVFEFPIGAAGDASTAWVASTTIEDARLRGRIGVPLDPANARLAVVLADGRRAALVELSRGYGIGGLLRVASDWSDELLAIVHAAAAAVLQQIIADLTTVEHDASGVARRVEALLGHAATHLALHAHPDGRITAHPIGRLCDEILSLPLFPMRVGGRAPGWRLVHRFCAAAAGRASEPTTEVLGELTSDAAPPLRAFVTDVLTPANIRRAPARSADSAVRLPGTHHDYVIEDHVRLARSLEHWLAQLRPDEHGPTGIHFIYGERDEFFAEGGVSALLVNPMHPLIAKVSEEALHDPSALAWLLLTLYGRLNALEEPVTHEHERQFQVRVARAVRDGVLALLPS
ncbi:hypothetical protein [Paraliomyxa miuraensis]|uniref:hypothetical protein n=1 Tax=Paraliomyxa miuraensis TaxID=376150 RepID=UPI002250465B|nr:hypothetical protein [Paraliomyxa miuraensis]MCX4240334.1 hypothetical protein [Paraliomyxa miuraensis]